MYAERREEDHAGEILFGTVTSSNSAQSQTMVFVQLHDNPQLMFAQGIVKLEREG